MRVISIGKRGLIKNSSWKCLRAVAQPLGPAEQLLGIAIERSLMGFGIPTRQLERRKMWFNHKYRKAYVVDYHVSKLRLVFDVSGDPSDDCIREARYFLAGRGMKFVRFPKHLFRAIDTCLGLVSGAIGRREWELLARAGPRPDEIRRLVNEYLRNGGQITYCPHGRA